MSHLLDSLVPGSPAPDSQLDTLDGRTVQLATHWQIQPIIIFFLRHLGCVFCRQQLVVMRQHYATIRSKGANAVAIVPIDGTSAETFYKSFKLPFAALADPQRRSYIAYGLADATPSDVINPGVLLRTVGQIMRGNIPTVNPFGAPLHLFGGIFIVDTAGIIRYAHIATPVFNYPPPATYLAALDSLRATSAHV